MMQTVEAKLLNNSAMIAGNESKYGIVIDEGMLKEWVGIGWIELRKSRESDSEKYPTVVRNSK